MRLRAGLWAPEGRHGGAGREGGPALFLPGRTEFLEKTAVAAAPLSARGLPVVSLDWRGLGHSDRLVHPPEKGHVADFDEYLADLAALLAAPAVVDLGPPRLVVAHSMGAAIALLARAAGVLPAVPLVLSAPMAGIALTPMLRLAVAPILGVSQTFGLDARWPPLPWAGRAYPLVKAFEDNALTGDAAFYAWSAEVLRADPRLATGLPSIAWFRAACRAMERIERLPAPGVPTLCLLGTWERVVEPAAVRALARRIGADLVEIEGARHDLFCETGPLRAEVWAAVDAFRARVGA